MQNKYLEMMEATQQAIAKANEISASAETVTNMLGVHKDDLARMGELVTGRFNEIRVTLVRDEEEIRNQILTLLKELDTAIDLMRGVEPRRPTEAEQIASAIAGDNNAEA